MNGLKQIEELMKDRVYSNNVSIYATISRNSRNIFTKTRPMKEVAASTLMKEMGTDGLGAVVTLLVENSLTDVFK